MITEQDKKEMKNKITNMIKDTEFMYNLSKSRGFVRARLVEKKLKELGNLK